MFSAVKDLEKTKEILGTKEQILYECQVFKRIDELLSNYIFLRIYETFILLSNVFFLFISSLYF